MSLGRLGEEQATPVAAHESMVPRLGLLIGKQIAVYQE